MPSQLRIYLKQKKTAEDSEIVDESKKVQRNVFVGSKIMF